jgi:hypothetical protein
MIISTYGCTLSIHAPLCSTGEPPDADTVFACKKLKACMALRDKYIGAHPAPPQDNDNFSSELGCITEEQGFEQVGRLQCPDASFRRRPSPHYDIFQQPLPVGNLKSKWQYHMVRGVMVVLPIEESRGALSSVPSPGPSPSKDNLDLSRSVFPVIGYKEFVEDFYFVRISWVSITNPPIQLACRCAR